MRTKRVIIGGIVGGVAFFLLGWLIWGLILLNYFQSNINQCAMRPMQEMIWWSLLLANFGWGFVLAVIYDWSKTLGWKMGALRGFILGALICISIDLGQYAMSTTFYNFGALIVDLIATAVMVTIGGGIIGWVLGSIKK